ncbi:MAG TPA: hypothetical protein VGM50_22675 [Gemmatimonadaceae bacterium]|jgi:hypothetical protein
MNPTASPTIAPSAVARPLLIVGLLQVVATFLPAAHVRLLGDMPFVRLPTAGMTLVILGLLTSVVALRPGWWRWIPPVASAAVVGVAYYRLRYSPAGSFIDPILRRVARPTWGFTPMAIVIALALVAAAFVRRPARVAVDPVAAS